MAKREDDAGESSTEESPKESRLARHRRIAEEIYAEPRTAGEHLRRAFVTVWAAHGAGFYGLGWICAFLVLEFNMITGEFGESDGVGDFLGSQLLEYLFRIGFMSFVNGILASIWPVYVIEWLGAFWAIALLVGGYLSFEHLLRPAVEAWSPELKAAREEAAAKSAEKARKKEEKKAEKTKQAAKNKQVDESD